MANQYEVVHDLLVGATLNDPEQPLTHNTRSHQYLTLNRSLMVQG